MIEKLIVRLKNRLAAQSVIGPRVEVHPSVFISGATIEGNVIVQEKCKIFQSHLQGDVHIGRCTSIWGPGISILSHLNPVTIGKFCSIARYVSIQESNHKTNRLSNYHFTANIAKGEIRHDLCSKGAITIANDVWVGANSVVLSGVTIGNGAVVGAGSVVTRDVPPYAIVAGNPAKVIKYRFLPEVIAQIEALGWWDWDFEKIAANRKFFETEIGHQLPDIE